MSTIQLLVEGAGCQSCVNAIEGALRSASGVDKAQFDLASKTATVESSLTVPELITIIDEAGYDAQQKS